MLEFQNILEQIKSVENQVFYIGLTDDEVKNLEFKINKQFPTYYREFLKTFGFQQDLVKGLFTNVDEFLEHNGYLEEYGDYENYLNIGDNDGENIWLIRTDDATNFTIYNIEDDELEEWNLSFEEMMHHAIMMRTDKDTLWESNEKKFWSVQFIINTNDEDLIYKTIPLIRKTDWKLDEVSEANVTSYNAEASLLNKTITIDKSQHPDWEYSMFSFDWYEQITITKNHSSIKEWEELLKQKFENFSLVDYGVFHADFFDQNS